MVGRLVSFRDGLFSWAREGNLNVAQQSWMMESHIYQLNPVSFQRRFKWLHLRLFQHTELEHTPSPKQPLPTGCKSGILSQLGPGGLPLLVCDIGVWHVTLLDFQLFCSAKVRGWITPRQGCRFVPTWHFRKLSATDGTKLDLNIGETRVWLWFRAKSTTLQGGWFDKICWPKNFRWNAAIVVKDPFSLECQVFPWDGRKKNNNGFTLQKTNMASWKITILIGNTSSNGCFFPLSS